MNTEEKYPLLIGHSLAGRTRLRCIQEVANFICIHGQYGDLVITQEDGTPFLDTMGIYIHKITDMAYREELLKVLVPMQQEVDGTNLMDKEMEANPMTKYERLRRQAEQYKASYPPGTRLMLLGMDDPDPVPPGTRGTVVAVDDQAQIHMKWDCQRRFEIVRKRRRNFVVFRRGGVTKISYFLARKVCSLSVASGA